MAKLDHFVAFLLRPLGILLCFGIIILSYLYIDKPLALMMQKWAVVYMAPWLRTLTKLGLGIIYIIFFFLLAMYHRYASHNRYLEECAWFLWACVVLPSILSVALKMLLGRARPELLYREHLYGFYWFKTQAAYLSFPSGHTTTVMGLMFGLCVIFPKYYKALLITGLIIACSRVILTHHFLSDILAGIYLAMLQVIFLKRLWTSRTKCQCQFAQHVL